MIEIQFQQYGAISHTNQSRTEIFCLIVDYIRILGPDNEKIHTDNMKTDLKLNLNRDIGRNDPNDRVL